MTDADIFSEVVGYLVGTARAHHEATGGPNPNWDSWYAEHLVDDLNETLGSKMEVDQLANWLAEADRRYREEPQTESWPKAYARWLVAEHHSD